MTAHLSAGGSEWLSIQLVHRGGLVASGRVAEVFRLRPCTLRSDRLAAAGEAQSLAGITT